MKPKTKKDYPYIVEFDKEYHSWKYVKYDGTTIHQVSDNSDNLNDTKREIPIISFEEFQQLPDGDVSQPLIEEKEIIGYKITKPEYKKAVLSILSREEDGQRWFIDNFDNNLKEIGYNFSHCQDERSVSKTLKAAGVLDLWFEPVYNKEESKYQELFNYMSEQHNVTLLESELEDIINIVNKIQNSPW